MFETTWCTIITTQNMAHDICQCKQILQKRNLVNIMQSDPDRRFPKT